MFERVFSWAMRHGSRLLFAAALVMLLQGLVTLVWTLNEEGPPGGSQPGWYSFLGNFLYASFAPAAYLLFGAVLTERLRRD